MANLICVKLEPCDDNPSGSSWYGYWDGEITRPEWQAAFTDETKIDVVSRQALGWDTSYCDLGPEQPNLLSQHTNLKRYFVAGAA